MLELNKYVILGDTHFGKSRGSEEFLENQLTFFRDQLIPFMKKNELREIIQLGDFLDQRKTIDGLVYYKVIELFEMLRDNGIKILTFLGNHDLYRRESHDIHLMNIFARIFPDVLELTTQQTYKTFNGKTASLIPWLTEGCEIEPNLKEREIILGHFEFKHFEVVKGIESNHGLDIEVFGGAKVYSGHYHNLQRKGNILYTGTPYQFDWSDFKEPKGFWVTDFHDIEVFFENEVSLKHVKYIYDDSDTLNPITVQGKQPEDFKISVFDFFKILHVKDKIKFIINFSNTGEHIKCIQHLKSLENTNVDIINNYQVSQIIKADYADNFKEHDISIENTNSGSAEQVILKACEENNISYVLDEIVKEKACL